MESPVDLAIAGGVARITLNRPDRLNALNRELMLDLARAITTAKDDESANVLLIMGVGRAFSVGQDLGERDPRRHAAPFDLETIQREIYHPVVKPLVEMDKPVLVGLNGVAAGAGAAIALAGDLIIASAKARFLFSFVKVGLSVDAGCGWQLVRKLGAGRAASLLMLGGEISAQEARDHGLVFKIVPDTELAGEATAVAAKLAEGPQTALKAIKRAVAEGVTAPDFAQYLNAEAALQGRAGAASDYREGVLSFLEKREPKFGR